MIPETLTIIAKLVGSVSGSILALVFQPPKTRPEFVTRAAFSLVSGMIFSTPVREYLRWTQNLETDIAAAALTALLAWWIMGAIVRIVGAWKPK